MKTIIHHGFSRRWLGLGLSFVAAMAVQAQTLVTFQVDMSAYNGGTPPAVVTINGSFNGWGTPGSPALTNVSGTIWSNTISISDPPGTVESCKFVADGNYETLAANRQFVLGPASPPTQVLPLETWNVNDWPTPTNQVTFQIDMSAQVLLGNFTNGDPNGSITVSGDFEGWNNGLALTNNPTLSGNASNVYSGTFPAAGFLPDTINYKFRMNGGWESPASTGGNNRQAAITNSTQILPLVYYNDNSIHDLVLSPITVTFSLNITNGTMDDTGYAFQKGVDQIYINGDFLGWWSWNVGVGGSETPADQMVEVGNSDIYTNSFVIPRGNSIYINYKYSLDAYDDENGFGTNHVREIRSYPPTYVFPQDVWSWTLAPSNTIPTIVEKDFGNLAIVAPSGGNIPITWLGRPGVVLENNSSLTSGIWTTNNGTDGTQSTNWPITSSTQFFRLLKEQ
jgi:hypothetical protein